jgi:hypothetical protein
VVQTQDAEGEAIEVPAEPRHPEPEPLRLLPAQMWDGKEVQRHILKFAGNSAISRTDAEYAAWWAGLRIGQRVWILVSGEVKSTSYDPVNKDGNVVGIDEVRKIRIDGATLHTAAREFTLFEDPEEPDEDEDEDADERSPLAQALDEALKDPDDQPFD